MSTAFYVESKYLDKKQLYQKLEYAPLHGLKVGRPEGLPPAQLNEEISQNTYLFVQEKEILLQDINNLCLYFRHVHISPCSGISQSQVASFPFLQIKERVCFIIQKYQEQAVLLDSLMEALVLPIMDAVSQCLYRAMKESIEQGSKEKRYHAEFHSLLAIVYILCKVCSYKQVVKFFPHQTSHFEPLVYFLIAQRKIDIAIWESKYVLILWLAILVLLPFDLKVIDSRHIKMEAVQLK